MKFIVTLFLCAVVGQNLASTFFGFPQRGKNGKSYIQLDKHHLSADVKYKATFRYASGCVLTVHSGGPMEPYTGTHLCLPKPPKKQPVKVTPKTQNKKKPTIATKDKITKPAVKKTTLQPKTVKASTDKITKPAVKKTTLQHKVVKTATTKA